MTLYDLGGVDEDENPGVYKFKQGMGGDEVIAPGPYECVADSLRGRLARAAEKAYRRVKGR
jgi:lipid II:glycine glycyltransferase (peptidoglycan interpeptide bridge formation enzyme)